MIHPDKLSYSRILKLRNHTSGQRKTNPSIAIVTFDLLNKFILIGFVFYKGNCFLSTYNKIPYNSLYLHEYIPD